MASSQEYLDYVLELLSDTPDITYRKMMGEYIIYCQDKVIGGIYDDRFLLKDTPASRQVFNSEQIPYEGATAQLLVDSENPGLISNTVETMLPHLPSPKKKGK